MCSLCGIIREEKRVKIGRNILYFRKEKGLTQAQLAEQLGISAQAVSKWEREISCPDLSLIEPLVRIFGITSDQLFGIDPWEQ